MAAESDIPTELGPAVSALAAGQVVFGRYTLRRKLGEGGFGAVWLVYDSALREQVAFKFVLQAVAASPEAIDALKDEASRSRKLTHPNIVRIHDFVSDAAGDALPTLAGISMEYVDGESLAQRRLRQPGKCFDAAQLAPWIDQICHALTYAHAPKRRVIHRDLKPPNLLVTADGELKVADFGIACSLINSVTQISGRLSSGTPPFMSPQQLTGDWPSETDDVYSLGASIYMLLTSTPPFHQGDIVDQVKHKVPVSMSERRAQLQIEGRAAIPAVWEETVAACLAKDVAQRPPTAEAVAQRLGLRGAIPAAAEPAREPIRVSADRLDALATLPAPSAAEAATVTEVSPARETVPAETPQPPTLPARPAVDTPSVPPPPKPRAPEPGAPEPRDPAKIDPPPYAARPQPGQRRMVWAVAALLVLLVLGPAYYWLRPGHPPAPSVPQATPAAATPGSPGASFATTPAAAPSDISSGITQADAVRLPFPRNPGFLSYDTEKEWGTLRADAWGYIDAEGHEVIPAQWLAAVHFSEGLAGVFRKEENDFAFIDPAGQTVISAHHQWLGNGVFKEGRARVRHPTQQNVGFIDPQGKIVVPLQWEAADDFTEGATVVQSTGKCAFLGLDGNYITQPKWESAQRFSERLAAVQTAGRWGYIDPQGKLVIPAQWHGAYPFSEGYAAVASSQILPDGGKKVRFGFIDREGKVVIPPHWEEATPFREGHAVVKHSAKWEEAAPFPGDRAATKNGGERGFIDPAGNLLGSLEWDEAQPFSESRAMVKRQGRAGYLDPLGKLVIPLQFDLAGSFFQGLAMAKRPGGKWGCIDPDGKTIIPFDWSYLEFHKAPDGRLYLFLARLLHPDPTPGTTNLPIEARWTDATGRVLWQSP